MPLVDLLRIPALRGVDLDDPATTLLHRRIIQSKPFLKRLYLEFYSHLGREVPDPDVKRIVELGSGGGFIKEIYPSVITSEILQLDGVDVVFSALQMPFASATVDAFFMIDVFHHVPDSARLLSELERCLKPGGTVVLIEPANTLWSRFCYTRFHHEAFDPQAGWTLEEGRALSCANGALPWIVFLRDRDRLRRDAPGLRVTEIRPHTPIRYLASGGLSMRQLVPNWAFVPLTVFEHLLSALNPLVGMFYKIVIRKP